MQETHLKKETMKKMSIWSVCVCARKKVDDISLKKTFILLNTSYFDKDSLIFFTIPGLRELPFLKEGNLEKHT